MKKLDKKTATCYFANCAESPTVTLTHSHKSFCPDHAVENDKQQLAFLERITRLNMEISVLSRIVSSLEDD